MASRGCVCFVGNLPGDVREREIEDLFYKYGRIRNIDLKLPPRPPAFAFVEFENPRDAEDAVRGRDGYDFDGHSIRVELSRGGMSGRFGAPTGGSSRGRDDYPRGGGGGYGGGSSAPVGRGPPPMAPPNFRSKGSAHRVLVKGLPMSASWQDLKDHFRKVCTPNYVNVFRDRGGVIGVVEFDTPEDLSRAIRKLDDTEFRNPFERAYVRVYDDSDSKKGGRGRSRSRDSRSYSRSRSRSPSDSRSRSRSASRSRSPSGSRSRSRSSRSASPRSDRSDDKGEKEDAPKEDVKDDDVEDKKADEDADEAMPDGDAKPADDDSAPAAAENGHKEEDEKAADEDDD